MDDVEPPRDAVPSRLRIDGLDRSDASDRAGVTGKGTWALALAELGLIDEYELVVHPRLVGHGPTLFAGLSKPIDLEVVSRQELGSGRS